MVVWNIGGVGICWFVFGTKGRCTGELAASHIPCDQDCQSRCNILAWNCVMDDTDGGKWTSVLLPHHHRCPVASVVDATRQLNDVVINNCLALGMVKMYGTFWG